MMDVSDGLLIDAGRMAAASGCRAAIELDAVPLSGEFLDFAGEDRAARLDAPRRATITSCCFAAPPAAAHGLLRSPRRSGFPCRASVPSRPGTGPGPHRRRRDRPCPIASVSNMAV
jgi:thiamine-monophosphate kinase